jgi:tetratricopeptide (TPR) repeat protein
MITRKTAFNAALIAGCLAAALSSIPVSASGGGGSSNQPTRPNCPKGKVWDSHSKNCVSQQSSLAPDADRTDYAYRLAKDGRYEEAIALLDTLKQPNTARALNYRGYATRKLGRTDEGIGYYLQAVKLDPHYAQVREYLGEAYVIKGRLDLAQDQLNTIKSICSTTCEEYKDLAEAIAGSSKT